MKTKRGYAGNRLQTAVDQADIGEYLRPPAGESLEFQSLWQLIVQDFPPSWFKPSDTPALTEYIRLKLQLDAVSRQVAELPDWFVEDPKTGKMSRHPLLLLQNALRAMFNTHGAALRLTPSARTKTEKIPKRREEPEDGGKDGADLRSVV